MWEGHSGHMNIDEVNAALDRMGLDPLESEYEFTVTYYVERQVTVTVEARDEDEARYQAIEPGAERTHQLRRIGLRRGFLGHRDRLTHEPRGWGRNVPAPSSYRRRAMSYKIDNPVAMVAHLPAIIEQQPVEGSWYVFMINEEFTVQGWTEYDDLGVALVGALKARQDSKTAVIPAVVRWGGIADGRDAEMFAGESVSVIRALVFDCIQVFEVMHGTARACSMLCDEEECHFCGSIIPVDPAPGQPYAGVPLAVGDMEFDTWRGSYAAAEGLVQGLLEHTDTTYGTELVFDQDEIPQLGALLSYRGGRDYMIAKCSSDQVFPNMALRMVMDHGDRDSPSVQNAACVLAIGYMAISTAAADAIVGWVLQTNPEHPLAGLLRRGHRAGRPCSGITSVRLQVRRR